MDTVDRMADELAAFEAAFPTYARTRILDELRARDYKRLDEQGHAYLDYMGASLYADSQLQAHMAMLSKGVFGNPHSSNPTSRAATQLEEHAREVILDYFNASRDEYCVIFTQNASGALKLVAESYPFAPEGQFLLTVDNHNSVNGIREYAKARGATVTYSPVLAPEMRLDEAQLRSSLQSAHDERRNFFAYPAQSNFSGVQHPLELIEEAHSHGWDVLLDAAAFAPTNRLDLSQWQPDFVPLSFYKMFGYPTGVGCLIARNTALRKLIRPWFAGGTVSLSSVHGDGYYLEEGQAGFEDGTLNYLTLPAIEIGLKHLEAIGIETIHERVICLAGWLLRKMTSLHHSNGKPLVRVYGPTSTERRGGTIAFNLCDPAGKVIDHRIVEHAANRLNISLRFGFFCNPGLGEDAMGLEKDELESCYQREERMNFEQFITAMSQHDHDVVGAVRASIGLVSSFADVYRFYTFLETFTDYPSPKAAESQQIGHIT